MRSTPPANDIAFPFNQRIAMAGWNLLFADLRPFTPDPARSADWNRGAYLTQALGHCGECHTPRGLAQNVDQSRPFAGALTNGWKAYNITGDPESGIGAWSDEALARYLSTGHGPGQSAAAGPMGEVVEHSLRYLTRDDIGAMVVYLRSIAPIRNAPAVAAHVAAQGAPTGSLGERLFGSECANCHRWDGGGAQSAFAALLGSRTPNDPDAVNAINIVLQGAPMQDGNGSRFMPPFAGAHSDEELAALVNFVNASFGNGTAHVGRAEIARARGVSSQAPSSWLVWATIAPGLLVLVVLASTLRRVIRPAHPVAT